MIGVDASPEVPGGAGARHPASVGELGLGSILLDEIVRAAAARGITRFTADVPTENRMLRLLSGHTVITEHASSDGVTRLVFRKPS